MTTEQLVVLLLLAIPLAGAVVVWCLGPDRGPLIRKVSVITSVITLVLALYLATAFLSLDRPRRLAEQGSGVTFVPEFVPGSTEGTPHRTSWNLLSIGTGAIQFFLGVDGLNLWLVVLTAVLMLPCVLVSF